MGAYQLLPPDVIKAHEEAERFWEWERERIALIRQQEDALFLDLIAEVKPVFQNIWNLITRYLWSVPLPHDQRTIRLKNELISIVTQMANIRDFLDEAGTRFYPINPPWSYAMDTSLLRITQRSFESSPDGKPDWEEIMMRLNDGLPEPTHSQTAESCRVRFWQLTFWDCTTEPEEFAKVF